MALVSALASERILAKAAIGGIIQTDEATADVRTTRRPRCADAHPDQPWKPKVTRSPRSRDGGRARDDTSLAAI